MGKRNRNIAIIRDADGNSIVVINDVVFKGKRRIDWDAVQEYLKQYVGEFYSIADSNDVVYIGADLPSEYSGSNYSKQLRGTLAKAKANAAQGIPEMIEIADNGKHEDNKKRKHSRDAGKVWYRFETRFAIPVYSESGEIKRYNVFHARLLIRHASSGKKYLYDLMEVKKETSKSCQV